MKILSALLIGATALSLVSCQSLSSVTAPKDKHVAFVKRDDYKKSHDVYKNEDALAKATRANTKVKVNLTDQRAQLILREGETETVALDTPCTTGKAGKRTPSGNFRITEKIVTKRSTIFGTLYKNGKRVHGGDRRKYRGSYDKYVGAPLPYWMRLTGDGIGMHFSKYIKRYPGSNGCIRMPKDAVRTIFNKTRKGTPVTVTHKSAKS